MTTATRPTKSESPVHAPQNVAEYEAMVATFSPELRATLGWIQRWHRAESAHSLRSRYELGTRVAAVYDASVSEANGGSYGLHALEKLEAVLDEDVSLLRLSMRFVKAYTPDQLDGLCDRVRANKTTLPWSVVRELLQVEDVAQREVFENEAFEKCLTSAALHKLIREFVATTGQAPAADRTGAGGPKMKMPSSPEKHAQKVTELAGTETKRIDQLATRAAISNMISVMSSDDMTAELVEQITVAKKAVDDEYEALNKLRADYDRALGWATRLWQKKLQEQARAIAGAAGEDEEDEAPAYVDPPAGKRKAVGAR